MPNCTRKIMALMTPSLPSSWPEFALSPPRKISAPFKREAQVSKVDKFDSNDAITTRK